MSVSADFVALLEHLTLFEEKTTPANFRERTSSALQPTPYPADRSQMSCL